MTLAALHLHPMRVQPRPQSSATAPAQKRPTGSDLGGVVTAPYTRDWAAGFGWALYASVESAMTLMPAAQAASATSTALPDAQAWLDADAVVEQLARVAGDDDFDAEQDDTLDELLAGALQRLGPATLYALEAHVAARPMSAAAVVEVLRSVGRIDEPVWMVDRLKLLQRCLFADRTALRHGAVLGLAHLDEPAALAAAHRALELEKLPWLQKYLRRLIEQIELTARESV